MPSRINTLNTEKPCAKVFSALAAPTRHWYTTLEVKNSGNGRIALFIRATFTRLARTSQKKGRA